jgi:hypothetical protein
MLEGFETFEVMGMINVVNNGRLSLYITLVNV